MTRDGHFILFRRTRVGRLHIVLNWFDELRRIVAAGGAVTDGEGERGLSRGGGFWRVNMVVFLP